MALSTGWSKLPEITGGQHELAIFTSAFFLLSIGSWWLRCMYICRFVFYTMCFPKTNPFQRGVFEDSKPATLTTKQSDLTF